MYYVCIFMCGRNKTLIETIVNDKYRISIGDPVNVKPIGTYGSGRVRFIGCVQTFRNSEQLFYGVALSNSNGKLDGTHKGVHYFNCKSQHGVLVRPDSLSLMTNEELFGESLAAVTKSLLKDRPSNTRDNNNNNNGNSRNNNNKNNGNGVTRAETFNITKKKAYQSARGNDDFFLIPEHYNHHNEAQFN